MGHRALVAYRRPDRLYDLRYSHWGGGDCSLADDLEPETPLAEGAVNADLLADSVALDRILTDYLDPQIYEALYLVADAETLAYRICWLEWANGRERSRGALIKCDSDESQAIDTWFRATKGTLADLVEMGALSHKTAAVYLESRVYDDQDGIVYTFVGVDADESIRKRADDLEVDRFEDLR